MGVPKTVEVIANHWLTTACDAGFPDLWSKQLYIAFCAVVLLTILASWIVVALATALVVGLLVMGL